MRALTGSPGRASHRPQRGGSTDEGQPGTAGRGSRADARAGARAGRFKGWFLDGSGAVAAPRAVAVCTPSGCVCTPSGSAGCGGCTPSLPPWTALGQLWTTRPVASRFRCGRGRIGSGRQREVPAVGSTVSASDVGGQDGGIGWGDQSESFEGMQGRTHGTFGQAGVAHQPRDGGKRVAPFRVGVVGQADQDGGQGRGVTAIGRDGCGVQCPGDRLDAHRAPSRAPPSAAVAVADGAGTVEQAGDGADGRGVPVGEPVEDAAVVGAQFEAVERFEQCGDPVGVTAGPPGRWSGRWGGLPYRRWQCRRAV